MLKQAAIRWREDNAMRLAAAVAMYSFLSLAPLLVIAIKVAAVVLSEDAARRQVAQQARAFLGPQAGGAVNEMIATQATSGTGVVATVLSLLMLLVTASGVFAELRDSLNAIWGVGPAEGEGWWTAIRYRLLSVGMVLAFGFLLLVSLVVSTVLTSMAQFVLGGAGWIAVAVDLVTSTLVIWLLFALLFRYLPDADIGWRQVASGAAATAVLFKIGQYLPALYFTYVSTGSAYGAAGSFVVLLLWVYYSCWTLFYGAELIQVRAELRGERFSRR
jgi:membrane protein